MKEIIEKLWEERESINTNSKAEIKDAIQQTVAMLDRGELRVAEKQNGEWKVNEWAKKAVLLYFKITDNKILDADNTNVYFDKVPTKFAGWSEDDFREGGFRVVPGAIVRYGTFIGKNAILMPSFTNIGAYVDEGTMVDTWATVGSCAQIGKNCHLSGGVGIGGVLEPLQANPVIIEDNVFIGARSEIAEGVIVREGSVISMGCYIGASTKIYNRATGEILYGEIPPYSVVVPGTLTSSDGKTQTYAVIIVKQVDEKTRSKTSINDLLRS
ncbi:2,3,4,5-tetrahydropyridine-2,6-dicarboxylate N-succinyltransferase [Nitrosophilus alvini]|uniref:2,3,4,5-tetrahydropyridine-2,6-dicarboxylate N-succinyltransferase n=1 Tax=Nitrosophilus alvini TaxID=2714855 RepID=UPI00190B7EC8|nr:2,3,4,5-tetrahydropyridine-2,6-dicarboxylate N-succinyltransferase [Nitrosophilus alvini]